VLEIVGFGFGLVIAVLTTPVGVSGAVFLLSVQLDVLRVPSPAVTPTNLLFNVVATPGALLRYHRQGQLHGPLVRQLLLAAVPGMVLGAVLRVWLVPDGGVFRLIAAAVLLPLGVWLSWSALSRRRVPATSRLSAPTVGAVAFVVGIVGGIYGIGGGSILGPVLVGAGMPVARVAPAALACTFVGSVAGVGTYAVLALGSPGAVAPLWSVGLACGAGGLVGGYFGARLQPHLPARLLRVVLGLLAAGLAVMYVVESLAAARQG
jgi:uncharacterized membrane protein YfcA